MKLEITNCKTITWKQINCQTMTWNTNYLNLNCFNTSSFRPYVLREEHNTASPYRLGHLPSFFFFVLFVMSVGQQQTFTEIFFLKYLSCLFSALSYSELFPGLPINDHNWSLIAAGMWGVSQQMEALSLPASLWCFVFLPLKKI